MATVIRGTNSEGRAKLLFVSLNSECGMINVGRASDGERHYLSPDQALHMAATLIGYAREATSPSINATAELVAAD